LASAGALDLAPPRVATPADEALPAASSPRSRAWRRLAHNKLALAGAVLIAFFLVVGALAPWIARYPFDAQAFPRNAGPGAANWLGTDDLGRDLFSRVVYGARISLLVGVATQLLVVTIGTAVGCFSAFYGRWVDGLIMRVTDVMYAFPVTLFAIVLIAIMGRQVANVVIALGIGMLPNMIRLSRSAALSVKQTEFVEAARAIGASDTRIMLRHLVPNMLGVVVVAATFGIPAAIMAEASLSFIGLGVRPPIPSWGLMVSAGFRWIRTDVLLALEPALAISLTLLAFNFLGDGLRDALDPKSKDGPRG
jgi:ABC-type dipeptide/oligopeptide/nickel transport system permease subunit